MYPITFLTSYLLLVFCHFGATEPPPAHGYGPPSPVEFNSNEVASQEQFDFGNYNFGSIAASTPSSYSVPSSNYKSTSGFGGGAPYSGGGFPPYKSRKGGVSSSYISVVHGPGGSGSASKQRPSYATGSKSSAPVVSSFYGANFGSPAAFSDGKHGASNPYEASNFGSAAFGKGFGGGGGGGGGGASASSLYNSNFDYPAASNADYNKGYDSGASDEVASYSSGGPSYATFTGSKPSLSSAGFGHGSRGNAYSTSNINFGGRVSGHGNFHPPAFSGNFKPSGSKTYSKYSSPSGGAYASGSSSTSYGGGNPLIGSETGYNSRALKAGYSVDGADELNSGEDGGNLFSGFSDGAGFKVQSSYSTG